MHTSKSSSPSATLSGGGSEVEPTPCAYVMVIEGDTSSVVQMDPVAPLVIGRENDCDVLLSSSDVSRRHAELRMTAKGATLVDLGSRHGIVVNGERVTSEACREVRSGDRIVIGSAHLVFYCDARPLQRRSLLVGDALRTRLHEEVQRAVFYEKELTVITFYASGAVLAEAEVIAVLDRRLKIIDVAGIDVGGELVIVVPDIDRKSAAALAASLHKDLCCIEPRLRCGVARCPEDGCDGNTIRSAARHSAQGPNSVNESASNVVAIGERLVVISDPTMESVYSLIGRLAKSALPVLINGETGVGKEIAATALHTWSSRKDAPFLALNCAALPTELAESALFGHERGAFTGAVSQKIGIFESANSGTVFLDELGELPLSIQAKLLRVLDSQRVTRLGDVTERAVDVRLIAATNRDLKEEIRAGRFREDLFFRLSTARVVLPPLRDRPRDLTGLASRLLVEACESNKRPLLELSAGAKITLHAHRWPGNIRELKNAMHFVAATMDHEAFVVEAWHLPEDVQSPSEPLHGGDAACAPGDRIASKHCSRDFRPIAEELRELESRRMREALEVCNYVQIEAARLLSMPMRTFATKVKRYELIRPRTGR